MERIYWNNSRNEIIVKYYEHYTNFINMYVGYVNGLGHEIIYMETYNEDTKKFEKIDGWSDMYIMQNSYFDKLIEREKKKEKYKKWFKRKG